MMMHARTQTDVLDRDDSSRDRPRELKGQTTTLFDNLRGG